ncbi:MAG: hypothetical protein MI743_13855 [Sneathiellales bacterium]|nr:hypothetical protein [Sneathiellales bacterium]
MGQFKKTLIKQSMQLHRLLLWAAAAALLLFVISAFTHPLMIWTGPRPASFSSPKGSFQPSYVSAVQQILHREKIATAAIVKIVPGEDAPLLQVVESLQGPKRYFDLQTQRELIDQDRKQARWLAQYYSGIDPGKIRSVTLQSTFDTSYPWVNRLLPVYKIHFDTPDNLTVFVHTETNALASMTNDWKSSLQAIFQTVHTGSWLKEFEVTRVAVYSGVLLVFLIMTLSGACLLIYMKARKISQKSRKVHRILAYLVVIPLLSLCLSGFYHLIKSSLSGDMTEEKPEITLSLGQEKFSPIEEQLNAFEGLSFNAISLVQGPDGSLFYRLGIPGPSSHHAKVSRKEQFDGIPSEKRALYLETRSLSDGGFTDREMAIATARLLLKKPTDIKAQGTLITRFGPEYDFRNKRLPVWKIVFEDTPGELLFIDPVSGLLVDRLDSATRLERFSFSWFHKWDFLVPLTGRPVRDLVVVTFLAALALVVLFGVYMRIRRPAKTKSSTGK